MLLLNRYILTQFLRIFCMVAAGFVAIYILIDFFEKIDNFMEAGKPLSLVFKFFLLSIPFIIDQLGPVLILLSGVITLGLLNHQHELTALKAGGIPLRAIVKPAIIGGLLCTLLFLVMAQWLLPVTISSTNTIWFENVKGMVPLGIFRNGRYYYKGHDGFYSFARPDPRQAAFFNFSYSSWTDPYNLSTLLSAESAEWKDQQWILHNGQTQVNTGKDGYQTTLFTEKKISLPETPDDFFVPEYEASELSITALYQRIYKQQTREDTVKAWADFYSRISYTLLGLPLLLLGLPVLLISYQKWGRDLSIAIPASCGLAFVAWGLWGALQSLARADYINPLLAAVIIHLFFGSAGLFLLYRQNK
ncbi:MAG: LptF/LptG family permease [Proteobacteria bacterium]|nr:YjgP/YjgQ family permease [Desulfocapsa sp.]MBU3943510.1 LptF/LptG family permease [Pseudomonadota bacterium]MCG2743398.1 LptF/LptG family permease [Desulfobacteraceae bacterium]MBU3983019.1 LptF/LptG family permease [Pseudomonadota bacterium]MBU4028873.1 LptF/LptG family permease [Pseudomonadota bacterium]